MAVRIASEAEQRRVAEALTAWSAEWTARQLAAGVDGPVPPGRKAGSDYNQHVPILEADGAAQDEYWARVDAILAGGA